MNHKTIHWMSAAFAISLLCQGCATYHEIATPFEEKDLEPYAHEGNSTITGQAFVTTEEHKVVYSPKGSVHLTPLTTYTRESRRLSAEGKRTKEDPRLSKYIRKSDANSAGKFTLNNLPAGQYYLDHVGGYHIPKGNGFVDVFVVRLSKEVTVAPGETLSVVLTNSNPSVNGVYLGRLLYSGSSN